MSTSHGKGFDIDSDELDVLSFMSKRSGAQEINSSTADTSSEGTEDDRTAKMAQAFKTILEVTLFIVLTFLLQVSS